jgi:hypothetical protein
MFAADTTVTWAYTHDDPTTGEMRAVVGGGQAGLAQPGRRKPGQVVEIGHELNRDMASLGSRVRQVGVVPGGGYRLPLGEP